MLDERKPSHDDPESGRSCHHISQLGVFVQYCQGAVDEAQGQSDQGIARSFEDGPAGFQVFVQPFLG